MSLFALYKSASHPSRREINDAIAGNLCRCTGYRPIVEAAERMYAYGNGARDAQESWMNCSFSSLSDRQPSRSERESVERLRSIRRRDTLALSAAGRRYWAPVRLAELAALCADHPEARIVAGATDVGLWVTKQHRDLDEVIYAGNVAELRQISAGDGHVDIGAAVTLTDAFAELVRHYPELDELCRRFASPPIRNAGTVGGNIANGSPIGDSMPALIALDTTLVLRHREHTREMPLEQFYVAYGRTALRPGELVERIRVPRAGAPAHVRSYKVSKRIDQDISAVCAGYRIEVDGGVVRTARIAYGGIAAIPKRAVACERALIDQPWTEPTVRAAMAELDRDFSPISDMRASASYRRLVTKNLLFRFWIETSGQAAATRVPDRAEGAS
jgi:xanthine dehydrogenase small subunit